MNGKLFPDEKHFISKKTRDPYFWRKMHEASFYDGSPFAIWSEIRLCQKFGLELPQWAMGELDRFAESILKAEKVTTNNFGEVLAELLNLDGDKNKSARRNRELLTHAFKIVQRLEIEKKAIIIDDLINIHNVSENQAKNIYKWAKKIKELFEIIPKDPFQCTPDKIETIEESIQDFISKLPKK